jgi:hypothetical protein
MEHAASQPRVEEDIHVTSNNRFKIAAAAAAAFIGIAVPGTAQAQLYLTQPDFRSGPIEPSDPLVGLPIPGATPAEYRANLLWNLRAGLNVAALSCQFSPYLRAVPNYNALLAHHSTELAEAYTTLNKYFTRVAGPKGQKQFDDYSTMTYNNFSTLQAQLGFCQTASNITKSAIAAPKGQLINVALQRMRELRNSLVPANDRSVAVAGVSNFRTPAIPSFTDQCWDKKGRLRTKCGGTAK